MRGAAIFLWGVVHREPSGALLLAPLPLILPLFLPLLMQLTQLMLLMLLMLVLLLRPVLVLLIFLLVEAVAAVLLLLPSPPTHALPPLTLGRRLGVRLKSLLLPLQLLPLPLLLLQFRP